tara:strand:+ start:466 stop:825 length:360 start_codon:yes stop_codon:yes gene_type:complete
MATFLREKEERLDTLQHQYEELIRELQAIKSGSSLTEQQVMDLSVENKGLKKRLREAQASNFFWTALFLILTVTSIVCYSVVSHASGGQPSAIVEIFEVLSALSLGCCGAWAWGVWYGK